ncbi:Six-hairpin glycosidase [Marasmius fiardii PR-910]|nr:Six-hairpin glycosidase [Marasmius fiardii PR-910]
MATSIISRSQGLATGLGGPSELLQAGFMQKAFRRLLESKDDLNSSYTQLITDYITKSVDSVVPRVSNATTDALTYPLDRLSNGNNLMTLYQQTESLSYQEALRALRESVDLQRRNKEGGLWYYHVYPEWSYLDGMFSFAPFHLSYALSQPGSDGESMVKDVLHQLDLLWEHCYHEETGLLVHGYDESLTAVWVNQDDPRKTGASPHVWGRSLGWYTMAFVDSLELISSALNSELSLSPQIPTASLSELQAFLLPRFQLLSAAILRSADNETGGWFQVIEEPGREGNYIESSASAMFVYSLLKGSRLGFFADGGRSQLYVESARKAYRYILDNFVVRNGTDGTLGYNGTVAVCSLNSTATFEYYVGQPISYNSVLGSAAFVLASIEYEQSLN